jgi:hypothetical protein
MVMEMRQFDLTRRFVCIFKTSINSIRGFIIFLLLMVMTFATTTNILYKNDFRHTQLLNVTKPWKFDEEFYESNNATKSL